MKLATLTQVVLSAAASVGVGRGRSDDGAMTADDMRHAQCAARERLSHLCFSILALSCLAAIVGLCGVPLLLLLASTGLIAWSTWMVVVGMVVALIFLAWGAGRLGGWFFESSIRAPFLDDLILDRPPTEAAQAGGRGEPVNSDNLV